MGNMIANDSLIKPYIRPDPSDPSTIPMTADSAQLLTPVPSKVTPISSSMKDTAPVTLGIQNAPKAPKKPNYLTYGLGAAIAYYLIRRIIK